MAYIVKFSSQAVKDYRKLTPEMKRRVDQKLDYLRATPRGPDTKKLAGSDNLYRVRVGDYRIVFEIHDAELVVWIVRIKPRDSVY